MPISTPEARNIMTSTAVAAMLPGFKMTYETLLETPSNGDKLWTAAADENWCRINIKHVTGRQETLGECDGKRRYNRTGVLTVQCFGSTTKKGFDDAEAQALAMQEAFQGTAAAGGIWFRDCTIEELGFTGTWYQVNMTLVFDYDHFA